jgi:general stress protein YciG
MKVRIEKKRRGVKYRGFGTLKHDAPDYLKEIASEGGKAAHRAKTAHEWTSAEAAKAGRKGGLATAAANRARVAQTDLRP